MINKLSKKETAETKKKLHELVDTTLSDKKFLVFVMSSDKKSTKTSLVSVGYSKLETLGIANSAHQNITDMVKSAEMKQMMNDMGKAMNDSIKKHIKNAKKKK